ncbi:hypothetical protein HMN09_00836100 [Mycena chlorophos]|uniref:Arrestin-like N-terminal domain-containing protein n=1 Tax=Mycena chlorophos TaxID=658473 RepID=A0A8H6SSZ7_MYCCL|nr:hypothetical protein HMN09_00836100 [Mycena chlorophos]
MLTTGTTRSHKMPMAFPPPAYTAAPPAPSYSRNPAHDEVTMEITPRAGESPTGVYVKRSTSCGDVLVLAEQEPNAERPVYGHRGVVSGLIGIEDRKTVQTVVLKVEGTMDSMTFEGGSSRQRLFNNTHTLWLSSSSSPSTSPCPGSLPFSIPLPTRFRDENLMAHPLPPSYDVPFSTNLGMFLNIRYSISVTITRARSLGLPFLSKTSTIVVPFDYRPGSRPRQPALLSFDLLEDVKIMPEEFKQVSWDVEPRPKALAVSHPPPLKVDLFLSTAEGFALDDPIPFHVQLAGPADALSQFIPRRTSSTAPTSPTQNPQQGITVSLVREFTIEVNDRKAARTMTLASVSFQPDSESLSSGAVTTLDFSGTVKPDRALAPTGEFDVGCVRLQDFVVVELWPVDAETRRGYTTLQFSHRIKLVTNSYVEGSPGIRYEQLPS